MPLKSTLTYLYNFISFMALLPLLPLLPLLASASQLRPANTDTLFQQHTQQQAQQSQFDGERTLSADEGWTLRNTLAWSLPLSAQELYVGADYGKISGRWADMNLGSHLAGGVVGLRGAITPANVSYDVSLGTPFSKPDGFRTDPATFSFSVNWNY